MKPYSSEALFLIIICLILGACQRTKHTRGLASDLSLFYEIDTNNFSLEKEDFEKTEEFYKLDKNLSLTLNDGTKLLYQEMMDIRENLNPINQKSSGGWGGTGGSGVVCFKDSHTAKNALTDKGFLKDNVYNQIQSITFLDLYEATSPQDFFKVKDEDTLETFMERILKEMEPLAPYFIYQLKFAIKVLLSEKWISNPRLPFVQDIGAGPPLKTSKCRRVQLAIRYSRAKDCHFPKVYLEVNNRLFEKLKSLNNHKAYILNQAMFLFHEATYLLGVEMGYKTSKDIREFVRFYINERGYRFREALGKLSPSMSLSDGFLFSFSLFNFISYRGLFFQDNEIRSFSTQSRRRSYSSWIMEKERVSYQARMKQLQKKPNSNFDEIMARVYEATLTNSLKETTIEEAFLEKSFAFFQQNLLKHHFDFLFLNERKSEEIISQVCSLLKDNYLRTFYQGKKELIERSFLFDKMMENDLGYRASIDLGLKAIQYCTHYTGLSIEENRVYQYWQDKYHPSPIPLEKRYKELRCQ